MDIGADGAARFDHFESDNRHIRSDRRQHFAEWSGRSSFAVVEGLLTDVGLGVLGWGFSTRGGVRVLGRSSHGGSRLPALDAHVFEGGPSVLRWVHGVCFSLWWRGSLAGLSMV